MIPRKIINFQTDLQNGMSIAEALQKNDVSFKEATERLCHSKPRRKKKKKKQQLRAAKYIQKRDGKYYVRKTVEGRTVMFGTYRTLEDAIKVRDYCIEHGWYQKRIDAICEKLGVERVKHHRNTVRYS